MASPLETTVTPLAESPGNATAAAAWLPQLQFLLRHRDFPYLEAQMVFSALAIIYVGAHGAIQRPPSAAPAKPKGGKGKRKKGPEQFREGLQASDAIMMPLLAGAVLVTLYYIIEYLEDPTLLNKILRSYMSVASVAGMAKLFADTLHLLTSLVFPNIWADRKGVIFLVDAASRRQRRKRLLATTESAAWALDEEKKTPFPDPLAGWAKSLRVVRAAWEVWRLLKEEWTVKLGLYGVGVHEVPVTFQELLSLFVASCIIPVSFMRDIPFLNNLMGLSLCYGAFMLMSCTSFLIGSLVLVSLFFYDIVMVFYTPYMVAVATVIDAPIKLVFGSSGKSSLLGLGDIVIPGMFICLCLRFDLWKYYERQVKHVPTVLKTQVKGEEPDSVITTLQTTDQAVKPPFVNPQGRWGDLLWTYPLRRRFPRQSLTPGLSAATFPKPYFYTALVGYAAGMVLTMAMVFIFKRGQPALLYLVPGVLSCTWARGYFSGELREMWAYTEEGSLDVQDVVVELDADGKPIEPSPADEKDNKGGSGGGPIEHDVHGTKRKRGGDELEGGGGSGAAGRKHSSSHAKGHDVLVFVIHAPGDDEIEEIEA